RDTSRGAVQTAPQGAKTNVQTTRCDQREPANASSLYLAIPIGRSNSYGLYALFAISPDKQRSLSHGFDPECVRLQHVARRILQSGSMAPSRPTPSRRSSSSGV